MEDKSVSNMTYRVVLLGIQEIVGKNGLKSVLNYTGLKQYIDNFPPNNHDKEKCMASEIARLDQGVVEVFGANGAYAVLFQVGKMQAKWGLEENPDIVEAAKKAIEDLPEREKVKTALEMTAATVSAEVGVNIWIEQEGEDFLYKSKEVSHCFDRISETPLCNVSDGFLVGILAWATGSNNWVAREESCMSMGETNCTFRVKKVSET
jgi:predicted hydrocarbon binding protein